MPGTSRKAVRQFAQKVAAALALSSVGWLSSAAQRQTAAQPGFEVAVVRRVDNSKLGDTISMNIGTVRAEQITFENATLNDCIRFAYGVTSDLQIKGPGWIKSKEFLYDITAKAASGTTQEQFEAMLRQLLTERFKLVVHREPKEMSYFALTVSKRGSQMRSVQAVPDGFRGKTWGGSIDSILTMPMLASLLSRFDTERPTIDNTGLTGLYEVKLTWTPPNKAAGSEGEPGVPLFTAVQEQLGLKLDARKGPVDVWVVDAAEKSPSDN